MTEILDISILRALQPGTPTPPARKRNCPPPLKLASSNVKTTRKYQPSPLSQVAIRTPVSSKSAAFLSPHAVALQRYGGSDFTTPTNRPVYDEYDDEFCDTDDEDDVEIYLAPMESNFQRELSLGPEELDSMPAYHIVVWTESGEEIIVKPEDEDWSDVWKALSQDTSLLMPGTYMWKDSYGEENVKHVKAPGPQINVASPKTKTMDDPDFPRRCPLPPHLADLPADYVCMTTQSGDERLLSPGNLLSLTLRDELRDEESLKKLPAGCTFRWRNENDESFVYTSPEAFDDDESDCGDETDNSYGSVASADEYPPSEDYFTDEEAGPYHPVTTPQCTRNSSEPISLIFPDPTLPTDPRSPRSSLTSSPQVSEIVPPSSAMNGGFHPMKLMHLLGTFVDSLK